MVSEAELFYLVVLIVLTLILHLVLARHDHTPH
jgi:hypothetical protein